MSGAASFDGIDRAALQRAGRMVVTIEGMWCNSCALAVERIIARVPGVTWASTTFAGGSALIKWEPGAFELDVLLARVEKLGYRIVPLIEADDMDRRIEAQASAAWMRLAVAVFFGMWSMLGSLALYTDSALAASPAGWTIALATIVAALPAVSWPAWQFYRAGWRTLQAGVPGMDALVSLGVIASMLLSGWSVAQGGSDIYVDTASMLVIFLLCGRLIELYARRRNSVAIHALRQAVPEMARVAGGEGGWREVPASAVAAGQLVRVHAGERVPVDGAVVDGESTLDRALVNGESAPAPVGPGDAVQAGCINLSCALTVRVVQPYGSRFIDRIGARMLEVFGAKSAVALQAERFARLLIPFALALTALTFTAAWWHSGEFAASLQRALSVLVAACPCAVGLALPLAYAASAATAARHGVLFRDPASMEALARAREIYFDKTGTLTAGRLTVAGVTAAGSASAGDVLRWAAAAEAGIAHPVASAIGAAAPPGDAPPGSAERHAQGTRWTSSDGAECVLAGTRGWLAANGVATAAAPHEGAGTWIEVARNGQWAGALQLQDAPRPEAAQALATLRRAGLQALLVTGDADAPALDVARAVGMAPAQVHAACLPQDKEAIVRAAHGPVVFVGDGINDALALAAADCGIAVRGAATAAVATAGVVIASGGIDTVVQAWRHARRTLRIVRQNLAFSVVYNIAILGLAAAGSVPPAAAAAAMLASSLSVIVNAARMTQMAK
ncbi:heavy metal translocating P-type ATPase [Massilia sp. GCM10020059]|uniref:Cation-translocating P-type ATPase n=1 Tax=Massilia agrisoli TaxID=2892444 RepID=A0ABS8IR04_9BURK|nr:cation-translocating P-type ATPase [Massilia agrisoli]MCC6070989.1 cation-translocating P-type ATPase [Massilia agrisoli]